MEHFRRVVVFLEHNQYLPCSLYTTMLQYYPRLVTWQCTTSLGWYISSLYPTHNGSYEMQKLEHPFCGSKINFLNQHRNFQISIRIFKSTASLYSIANSTMHRLSLCYKQINMYIYGELNARQNDVLIGFSQVKRHFPRILVQMYSSTHSQEEQDHKFSLNILDYLDISAPGTYLV